MRLEAVARMASDLRFHKETVSETGRFHSQKGPCEPMVKMYEIHGKTWHRLPSYPDGADIEDDAHETR